MLYEKALHKRVYTLHDFIIMIFFTVDKFCLDGSSYKWSYQKKKLWISWTLFKNMHIEVFREKYAGIYHFF